MKKKKATKVVNMNAEKEAIRANYPEGLFGFVHTPKEKVYSFAGRG